ncbi:MAG: DUF1707 domain-containing protein [Pseudonocardia sp.]|nr:DUF1707 domain-containing protein [Pseudonocardia sp.]
MNEPVRPEDMRVSDADRVRAQRHLQWAQGEGLLDLGEFDERVSSLWSAKTRGELDVLTQDLPVPPRQPGAPAPRSKGQVFAETGGGTAMRVLTIVFCSILAVNVVAWGLVSLTTGEAIHPWFVWTTLPLVVLGVLYTAGIGRPGKGD